MAAIIPSTPKSGTVQDARTIALLNIAAPWGDNRGVQLWTKYSNNFRIGDFVYINRGYYSNIAINDSYSRDDLDDWTIGWEVIYVSSVGNSIVIKTPYISNIITGDTTPVFISATPFVNGTMENATSQSILLGASFGDYRDLDYTQALLTDYRTEFPVITGTAITSGVCINGTMVNVNWLGDKVAVYEYDIYNGVVLPRQLNAIVESLYTYSVLLQGNFSGTWYNGLWERGIFDSGIWYDGWFRGGEFIDGTWYDGIMEALNNRLEVKDIIWYDGVAKNIIWRGGVWYNGNWKGNDLIVVDSIVSSEYNIDFYSVYLSDNTFLRNFLVGDITIFTGAVLTVQTLEMDNIPFVVVWIGTDHLVLKSLDGIPSGQLLPYMATDNIVKITNSCWNSGVWNGGFWRGGIKGDTSYWVDTINTGTITDITVYKTALFPYEPNPILNYVFSPSEFITGSQINTWNLSNSTWILNTGPTGLAPLTDFTIGLTGSTTVTFTDELSPTVVDFSIWRDGVWDDGLWMGGVWGNGLWNSGIWLDGVWDNGTWNSGEYRGGFWYDGIWKSGRHTNSILTGITSTQYFSRPVTIDGVTNPTRAFAGSSVWNGGTWQNGYWERGLWVSGDWVNGYWAGGSQFSMLWENGTYYTSGPVEYTQYQPGYLLYDIAEEWGGRIESIQMVSGVANYVLLGGTTNIAYNDPRLLHSTGSAQTTHKTVAGVEWRGGLFNAPLQGTTTTDYSAGVWIKGDFKNGTWYNGIWSPLDDKEVYDNDTVTSLGDVYTGSYPGSYLDYTVGKRHNVFQSGTWYDGYWYNGYIFSGQFSGGEIYKSYAVSSQGDIDMEGIAMGNNEKYFVHRMGFNPINFVSPGGPQWMVEPSALYGVDTTVTYQTGVTSDFVKWDIVSIPGLVNKWSTSIDGITAVNGNTISINIDLGGDNEVGIRTNSYIEIRGLVKKNIKAIVPDGFHYIQNIWTPMGMTAIVSTGTVGIQISTPYLSSDVIKGLDWADAYIVRGDSIIIDDTPSSSFTFSLLNPVQNGDYINEQSINNGIVDWVNTYALKPSVDINPRLPWSSDIDLKDQVYLSAENGLYRNTVIGASKTVRMSNSIDLLGVYLSDDMVGSGNFYLNSSGSVRMSQLDDIISNGVNIGDTVVSNGQHNGMLIERSVVKGIDNFGYRTSDVVTVTNGFWGLTSPAPFSITGITITGNHMVVDFSGITGTPGYRPYGIGDLINIRGAYSDYSTVIGGAYGKSHLVISSTGVLERPDALKYQGWLDLTTDYLEFHNAYAATIDIYPFTWLSSVDFSNANISGNGGNATFNGGVVGVSGMSSNMVLFSDPERNDLSGPTGFVGLSNAYLNIDGSYNIQLENGITFAGNYLYSIDFYDPNLELLSQYGISGGVSGINVYNKISPYTQNYLITSGPHKVDVTYLRPLGITASTSSYGDFTPVWNTGMLQSQYSEKTQIEGTLTNSIIYKATMNGGMHIAVTGITGSFDAVWLNGIWNSGNLSGQVQVNDNTSYPDWTTLLSWKGGFWNGGSWYGGIWDRGRWSGGIWDSGIWESIDTSVGQAYDINQSIWTGGIFRSVILNSDGTYTYAPQYSVWAGGKWMGTSGFLQDGNYIGLADPTQDYATIMHDDILKTSWNGPFNEFEVDSLRSVVLPNPSSVWIGGRWLRGDWSGGIFFNGEWWSSERAVTGPYPITSDWNVNIPFAITTQSRVFDISSTGPNSNSYFHSGAFLSSVWEGGFFGDYNTGPTGQVDVDGYYWRSNEYQAIFGMYIPQDRNLVAPGNVGWDYSDPIVSTRATWTVNDSPFVIEFQKTSSNTTNIFEWRNYVPNALATTLMFGKNMFIPNNISPLYQPNGLMQDLPMSSQWKRGVYNNGISQWSVFDSLLHSTTPSTYQQQNWDYSPIEAHASEVISYSVDITGQVSSQPTVAYQGFWNSGWWNAGTVYFSKVTLHNTIWVNGTWSDIDAIADSDPTSPVQYFNPYDDLGMTGPASTTGGYGPPNAVASTENSNYTWGKNYESNPYTWEEAVTGVTGDYGAYIKYISDPSWLSVNVNYHKNFYSSVWYGGLWDGGRFELSVWNSYAPGVAGWQDPNDNFVIAPFIGTTGSPYSNWVYQWSGNDYRDRWNLSYVERYEVQQGSWPLGWLDTYNSRMTDNVQGIDLLGIADSSPKDPITLNLFSYFDVQSNISEPIADGKYHLFERDLLTGMDFQTWVMISNSDTTGPDPLGKLVISRLTIDFPTYAGLSQSFALAWVAKVGKVAGPYATNQLTYSLPNPDGTMDYYVGLNGESPIGYLPSTAQGTYWQGLLDAAYVNGRVYATLYQNEFNSKIDILGVTGAHTSAIAYMESIYATTAFDYSTFDDRLIGRLRLAGELDNYVSRWYRGEFKGSIWNGGIWETGLFQHLYIAGDGFSKDWFGRTIPTGTNYTLPSAWLRGVWKSGMFSTRDISERGVTTEFSSDKRSYKKSFFMSVPLVATDTDTTSNYDNRTVHGLSETMIKASIEYPLGQYPALFDTKKNDYYMDDQSNLASWFTRSKPINDPSYFNEIEQWYGPIELWADNNRHQLDWHYFSEFNGVFVSGIFFDIFKKNTFVMDYRGIPQRTPLLSSYAEWGNRPSLALQRSESLRRGLIYGNQPYTWNWGYDQSTLDDMYYKFGYDDEGTITELTTGPFYFPMFMSSRSLFRIGPDHINEVTTTDEIEPTDYGSPLPVIVFPGQTATYQGAFPQFGEWYLTPGMPCYSFPNWATGPLVNDLYYSDGNNMKNTMRIYSTKPENYYNVSSSYAGSPGVESMLDDQYLGSRNYYYDYFTYNLVTGADPRQDINYLSSPFSLDGLTTPVKLSNTFIDPVYMPNGAVVAGTLPPYVSYGYNYGGLTGRVEEDLLTPWRLWPVWFYGSNIWVVTQEDIHNYGTWELGAKFLGESKQVLKYIFDWIPSTGGTNPNDNSDTAGWGLFQSNSESLQENIGWAQDYYYNNILDREYNYGEKWIGFQDNLPPSENQQTVLHYNFGDGFSWIWPKVLFTEIFDPIVFFEALDYVDSNSYQFAGITPPAIYSDKPLISRYPYLNRGISNLNLKRY